MHISLVVRVMGLGDQGANVQTRFYTIRECLMQEKEGRGGISEFLKLNKQHAYLVVIGFVQHFCMLEYIVKQNYHWNIFLPEDISRMHFYHLLPSPLSAHFFTSETVSTCKIRYFYLFCIMKELNLRVIVLQTFKIYCK